MLEIKYSSESDIPAEFVSLYSEKGGEFVLTGVNGLKTDDDIDRVFSSLEKERSSHKDTKAKLRKFNGFDPDTLHENMDKFDEYKAIAEGKGDGISDEAIEARIKTRVSPLERQLAELNTSIAEKDTVIEGFTTRAKTQTIRDSLSQAAKKHKVVDTGFDDLLSIGQGLFEIDERGQVIAKDGAGVTPGISAEAWLTDIKTSKPHFFPASQGAGARGGAGGAGGTNPWAKGSENITEQGRIFKESPTRANDLAKAAGVTLG